MQKIWHEFTFSDRIRVFVALSLVLSCFVSIGITIYFLMQHKTCKIIKIVPQTLKSNKEKIAFSEAKFELFNGDISIPSKHNYKYSPVKIRKTIKDFPQMVISVPRGKSNKPNCVGVFIHPIWILIHKACIYDDKNKRTINFNIILPREEFHYHKSETIDYRETVLGNEINLGMIRAQKPVDANAVAKLPKHGFQINQGGKGYAVGWYNRKFHSPLWSLYSSKLCALYFRVMTNFQEENQAHFCAGDMYGLEQECIGPLSGPLFYQDRIIIGFHHIKTPHCSVLSPEPLVYVKVSAHLNWLEEVLDLSN